MALANSGITTSAVGNAIGTNSRDVGTLCTSSLINIWSVWKPIGHTATTLNYNLLEQANFGIDIKSATTAASLLTIVTNNGNLGYTYNKPTSNSGFRLGDFRNYDHSANLPVDSQFKDNDEVKIGGVDSTYSTAINSPEVVTPDDLSSVTYLTVGHLYPSGLRRGVLFTDGTNTSWSVSTIHWGNTYWQRFKGKTVTALEFLTNLPSGTTFLGHTSAASDRFYALPNPKHSIKVSSSAPAGSKIAFPVYNTLTFTNSTNSVVSYNFKLSAVGDTYRGGTITNFRCGLASDMKGINVITQKLLSNSVNIPAEGTTTDYFGTFNNSGNSALVFFCIWYNNSLQHVSNVMQEVQPQ